VELHIHSFGANDARVAVNLDEKRCIIKDIGELVPVDGDVHSGDVKTFRSLVFQVEEQLPPRRQSKAVFRTHEGNPADILFASISVQISLFPKRELGGRQVGITVRRGAKGGWVEVPALRLGDVFEDLL